MLIVLLAMPKATKAQLNRMAKGRPSTKPITQVIDGDFVTKHLARLGGVNIQREGRFKFDTPAEALEVARSCKQGLLSG